MTPSAPTVPHAELISHDEAARLAAVRRYDILDTPPDGAFDRIAALAARVLGTPIATVTIVDHDRIWFKAARGIDTVQIDRLPGLCASAILQDDAYVVTDARIDTRTLNNPLVSGELGLRFYAAAPLVTSDGYRLGTVNVIDRQPREVTAKEIATLEDLAAIVVDELELRLSAREVRAATAELVRLGEAVQSSVRPPEVPRIPGLDVAASYQPGGEELEIGGDFYDIFESRPGTWIVAIGDVCGRGVEAAVLMSAVRHRLRALAEGGRSPHRALADLSDSLVKEDHGGRFCTLCYLEIRPRPGRTEVSMTSGGHPLPVLRRADGTVGTVGTPGSLLGALPDASLADTSFEMGHGDVLLLYTDGVVEDRGVSFAQGEQALRTAVASCADGSAASVLRCVDRAMPRSLHGRRDDRALVVLRVCA